MSIGQRLKEARERLDLSQSGLAKRAGVSQPVISDLEAGVQTETRKLTQIAKALMVNAEWLGSGRGPMSDLAAPAEQPTAPSPADRYEFATRVHGTVLSAGNGGTTWEHEEIDGSHAFTRDWLQRKRLNIRMCRVLSIDGDSMQPELSDGYVVLIDLNDCSPIKSGKVYAISIDGEQRIKRLFRQADGSLLIRSDNPDKSRYPDELVAPQHLERVKIIGRKRWHAGDDD